MPGGTPTLTHLQRLTEITHTLDAASSLEDLLQVGAEQARVLLDAHQCAITFDGYKAWQIKAISFSTKYARWEAEVCRLPGWTLSHVLTVPGVPRRLSQAELEALLDWEMFTKDGAPHLPAYEWLGVILCEWDQTPVSLIQLSDKNGRDFDAEDEASLALFAQILKLAIRNWILQHEAQQATSTRDRFLSTVAHELKNPLTGLRGFAQLLLRQLERDGAIDPTRLNHALHNIDQQSERLAQLVSDLREAACMYTGRISLDTQIIDIVALIEGVAAQVDSLHHEVNVEVPPVLIARVDSLRLRQALVYILENAVRSSPDGGEINVCGTLMTANPGQMVQIAVAYQCAPGHRESIANYLHRDNTIPPLENLALYMAHQIITLHHGLVQIETLLEDTIRFVIQLPACD